MRAPPFPRRPVARPFGGQGTVEFALVSLVFLMLSFGTIDLGRAVFQRGMLTNAVREAARYGAIAPADTAGIVAAAQRTSPSLGLTAANLAVTCQRWDGAAWGTIACGGTLPRDRLVIGATHTFGLTAPRLLGLSSIPMRESVRVRIQ